MTNAPTRPPTYRAGRPRRDPRPVTTAPKKLRADLAAASKHLRATDAPHLADTIDELLLPTGWGKLRRAVEPDTSNPTESLKISQDDRDYYLASAKAAGSSITDDAVEGLEVFIAGSFSPAGYPRRSTGVGKLVTTSFRVPEGLMDEFAAAAAARKDEIGYEAKPGHVVKAWLSRKYPRPAK